MTRAAPRYNDDEVQIRAPYQRMLDSW